MKKKKLIKENLKTLLKSNQKYKKYCFAVSSQMKFYFNTPHHNKGFFEKIKDKFAQKKQKVEVVEDYSLPSDIQRYYPNAQDGLTNEQVEERIASKLTNENKIKSSKSYGAIFAKNIFTFFNMLWAIIAIALCAVGSYKELMFVFVIVANTAIAIIQEIRAKIAVEKLSMITSPLVKTIRDGNQVNLPADKLVLDDVIYLTSGNQIPSDCKIIDGKVEVNESLLTGESNSIEKTIDEQLLSGSFIVSGVCYARIEKVGKSNYIHQIAKKAKEFKAPQSNLFKDLNRLIKYIGIALVPIGILTFLKEYAEPTSTIKTQIENTSGALTSMIPAGMFLLVTISLAVGVVKLAKKKTLVKDLYSIEMLARTNVLCLDKTGTITDGTMNVVDFVSYSKKRKASVQKLIANVLNAQKTSNATSVALIKEFGQNDSIGELNHAEFSSDKKYSITQLSNKNIYFLGAYSNIKCPISAEQLAFIEEKQSQGMRILAFAEQEGGKFDKDMDGKNSKLLALIVIEEHIRETAVETIQWFKYNGVEVKIISGDAPQTVAKIAQRVGVENSDKYISLEGMSIEEVEQIADKFTVFGRVTPEQKYTLVKSLKKKGKVVTMTGDGVNDTLALKEADCSVAMADGSEVARGISNLILLDSNFASLPAVVKEGRQVINNVQNSASLFLMKTFFAIILTVLTLFVQINYPFKPSMMLLLEAFVIGIPSFILTFEPNTKRINGNFIPQVMKRSIPRALLMLMNVIIVMVLYHSQSFNILSYEEYKTLCVLVLTYSGFLNLVTLCVPTSPLKWTAMSLSFGAITLAICVLPNMFSIESSSATVLITFFAIMLVSIIVLTIIKLNSKRIDRLREKIISLLQKQS